MSHLDESIMELYTNTNQELESSRTLDHYYQNNIEQARLEYLNDNQVFTRFLRKSVDPEPVASRTRGQIAGRYSIFSRLRAALDEASELENGIPRRYFRSGFTDQQESQEQQNRSRHHESILVVSQLWLYRSQSMCSPITAHLYMYTLLTSVSLEDIIVTSFPQRRSAPTGDERLQLPQVIQKLFKSTESPHILYHEIIKKSMQYQSSIEVHEERMTYLDVFSKEVMRIVSPTQAYHSCVLSGNSNKC